MQYTPFVAQTEWNVNNIDFDHYLMWESASLSGSIEHTYIDYGDGTQLPTTNSNCVLIADENDIEINYQRGEYITGSFFPTSSAYYQSQTEPLNSDGTYVRIIYSTNKNLFYSNIGNPTRQFGIFDLNGENTNHTLSDVMDVFTVSPRFFGEKIIPNSVIMYDSYNNTNYKVIDDGNSNLVLSGSQFLRFQTVSFETSI